MVVYFYIAKNIISFMLASLTFNVLDQKPHLVVQLINGPSECGGVGGDNAEQQQSCQLCIVS